MQQHEAYNLLGYHAILVGNMLTNISDQLTAGMSPMLLANYRNEQLTAVGWLPWIASSYNPGSCYI